MLSDFGDHPARLGPASRLMGEIGMEPTYLVRRSPDRELAQVAHSLLQNAVGQKPDHILYPLGFEKLVAIGIGEGRVGAEIEARDLAAIARRDRQPSALWMMPGRSAHRSRSPS